MADAPNYPIRTQEGKVWLSGIRHFNPNNFVPELDFERYRYVLAHVPDERFLLPFSLALGECGRPVAYFQPFALIESRCLKFAMDTPEPPLPENRPKTLGWRLRHLPAQPPPPSQFHRP
jgi:hypothetical protein